MEVALLLDRQQRLLLEQQRAQLWEMALPLADSLTRLDKRQLASQMQGVEHQQELRELLLEVLQEQRLPLRQVIFQELGQSSPPPSFQHSVTSAPSSRRT
jgi:hypothetical protein